MHTDNNDIRVRRLLLLSSPCVGGGGGRQTDREKEALNVSEDGEAKAEAVRSVL